MKELPKADKLTIALLLLPPATAAEERELVIGDASIGGDSGGEFNPALQSLLFAEFRSSILEPNLEKSSPTKEKQNDDPIRLAANKKQCQMFFSTERDGSLDH